MTVVTTSLPCRQEFPALSSRPGLTYLNACFQQPLSRTVHDACVGLLDAHLNDPSPKQTWYNAVETTRSAVQHLIGADADTVAFTKNTSEGINMFVHALDLQSGDNVLVLDGEHPNQVYAWMNLEKKGVELRRVPQTNYATADTFAPYVDDKTKAIGISWVMFHSGQRNDIEGICAVYRPKGIDVLVDATQAIGLIDLRVAEVNPSAVAMGCHKGMGTPAGQGLFYVDPEVIGRLAPTYVGPSGLTNCPPTLIAGPKLDGLQPNAKRFETGNWNYLALAGLAAYIDLIERCGGQKAIEAYLYDLSGRMIDQAMALGVKTVAQRDNSKRSPHNTVFRLTDPAWDSFFKEKDVLCIRYREGTRVSIGMYNNAADIDRFIEVLQEGQKFNW